MRKITLLFMIALMGTFAVNAQVLYTEDFEGGTSGEPPADMTLYDEDGDGSNWLVIQFTEDDGVTPKGTQVLVSDSWASFALTPDNYAVTPEIDLSEADDAEATVTLSWDVAGVDALYSDENYSVYVATDNTVDAFLDSEVSFTEVVTENGDGGLENLYTKELDITSFAGESVYVAFRHHDVTDQFRIAIDNIKVEAGDMGLDENHIQGFNHYYNPNNAVLTLQANNPLNQVELYNLLGQKVIAKNLSETNEEVNLSGLNAGIYLAKVVIGDNVTSFKVAVK